MDPVKSQKPQEPLTGAGKGGRVGASATQHVVQSMFRCVLTTCMVRICITSVLIYVDVL
jgi:hypothetical protein